MPNSIVVYPKFSDATNQAITSADYISLSVKSAFLDPNKYPETWLIQNTITFSVAVQAAGKSFSFPIYTDYSAGSAQRLAINQHSLLADVPCNGNLLGVSASVYRSDKNDFVPTVINLLSNAKSNVALTTYATSAIPGIQLAGIVAGDLYNTFFPQHGSKIIDTTPANLSVGATGVDNLRDCYMLQYEGSDDMNGDQLEVMDNGDVIWAGQSQNVLRSGSWILFRIQGTTSRADQSTRPWDIQFQKAIGEYSGLPGTDPQSAEKEFSDAGILLTNDLDVTQGNKRALQRDYGAAYEAAKNGHHDGHAELVAEAIRSSQTEIVANGKTKTMIDPIALNTALRSISAIAAQGAAAG